MINCFLRGFFLLMAPAHPSTTAASKLKRLHCNRHFSDQDAIDRHKAGTKLFATCYYQMGTISMFKPLPTFLQAALLINLSNIENFSSDIFWGMLGIKPGAAGSGSKYANHCAILIQLDLCG